MTITVLCGALGRPVQYGCVVSAGPLYLWGVQVTVR